MIPRAKAISAGLILAFVSQANAQDFPARPIRIVTAAASGTGDFASRLLARGLTDAAGWAVVVDNRAGGLAAMEAVVKAAPDGYTLLVDSMAFLVGPLKPRVYYDMVVDFAPVAQLSSSPAALVTHPSLGTKAVKDLIALAKARPGELNYSSTGVGGIAHLTAEMFKSKARVSIVHVPYKSTSQAMTEVIAGQVHVMFVPVAPAAPHIRNNRLRALAITSAHPSPLLPGLAPISATLPGFESTSMVGLFAPQKTPPPLILKLGQEAIKAMGLDDIRARFIAAGAEPAASPATEFSVRINSESAKWTRVVLDAGITAQ